MEVVVSGGCTNPPTAGTAVVTPSTVCSGASVSLNLSGNSSGTGQTYQWQRDIGGGFVNIGGSLASPVSSDIPSSSASYRCVVTCGASVNSVAAAVTVNPLLPAEPIPLIQRCLRVEVITRPSTLRWRRLAVASAVL
jgi:hypothetical protein